MISDVFISFEFGVTEKAGLNSSAINPVITRSASGAISSSSSCAALHGDKRHPGENKPAESDYDKDDLKDGHLLPRL
jgi:hypothetical protein